MEYESFFISHVRNLRSHPNSAQAYGVCPLHEDRVASFSVNLITGLWSCHAGCGSGNTLTFSRRLGLTPPSPGSPINPGGAISHRVTSSAKPPRATPSRGKIKETYEYQYEDGSPAHRVTRYEPKGFSQQKWQNGAWVSGTSDIRKVPYRLPQILKTDKPIYLVEGEKDVHRLESIDMVATTTPMGANSWNQIYASYFKGKRVVIIPDNDPPGKAFAERAAQDLIEAGATVKLVKLPVPEKQDVSDFLDDPNNSKDTLLALVSSVQPITPFKHSPLNPVEYFAGLDIHITPGKSLFPGEFRQHCHEAFILVCERAQDVNTRVEKKVEELDSFWKKCDTEWEYSKFLKALKEMHELSLA